MGIGLLLLALLPLAFFPDLLFGDSDEADTETNSDPALAGAGSLLGDSDVAHDYEVSVVSLLDADSSNTSSDDSEAILEPVIEDDQQDTGIPEPDPDDILAPIVEDDAATPSDGQEGEILDPVIEDDSEPDIVWVESDEHADDGEDSLVFVDEHLVAVLKGVASATVADVYVDTNWLAA